jgi:hypothetical protein
VGRTISLKRGRADTLLDRVLAAVRTWPDVADDLAIPGATIAGIKNVQRLDL